MHIYVHDDKIPVFKAILFTNFAAENSAANIGCLYLNVLFWTVSIIEYLCINKLAYSHLETIPKQSKSYNFNATNSVELVQVR